MIRLGALILFFTKKLRQPNKINNFFQKKWIKDMKKSDFKAWELKAPWRRNLKNIVGRSQNRNL